MSASLRQPALHESFDDNPYQLTEREKEIVSTMARQRHEAYLAHLISALIHPQPPTELVAVEDIPSAWGY